MKKPRSSLFIKIFTWMILNLTILPIILIAASLVFNHQIIIHDTLAMQGSEQMRNTFSVITKQLSFLPQEKWDDELILFADAYQVDFILIFEDGKMFSSREIELYDSILTKVRNSINQARVLEHEQSKGKNIPLLPEVNPIHPDLLMQTRNPDLFWTGFLVELPVDTGRQQVPAMLSVASDSVTGNGFIFDPTPWLLMIGIVLLLSVILWIPVVRHITRPLGRMTKATEKIAKGRFDVSLETNRNDEIGRLALAINDMSLQLSTLIKGQKRFLGDIAHELGSPIARIQFGLGALEQRVDKGNRERVCEVMEEVNHMSSLVRELLALSRVELETKTIKLEELELLPIVQTAVEREFEPETEIIVDVDPAHRGVASSELLTRALSNLIRNSIKYAGDVGPIRITSHMLEETVQIEVIDQGPGVAEEYLGEIFEPFYRPEPSRDRGSGGVGLGLAIVKTCMDNCQGSVSVRNVEPRGFSVTITLARKI